MKDKNWVINLEKKAFKILNSRCIWYSLIGLLIVAVLVDFISVYRISLFITDTCGIDMLSVYYALISALEYDMGVFVSILTVIWAFMVGFSSIFFDKLDNKFYGIRVMDIIEYKELIPKIVAIVIIAVIELILIIFGSLLDLKLTMCVDGLLLLNTMLLLFLFIVIYFSRSVIIEMVDEELQTTLSKKRGLDESLILGKMINNLDYQSKEDVHVLLSILERVVKFHVNEEIKPEYTETDRYVKNLVYSITTEILDNIGNSIERKRVIRSWFIEARSSAMQVGILYALLDRETKEDFEYALSLVKHFEEERCRKLRMLMLLHELDRSIYERTKWKIQHANQIFRMYLGEIYKEEVVLWHDLWRCICTDDSSMYLSYKFIDENKIERAYK